MADLFRNLHQRQMGRLRIGPDLRSHESGHRRASRDLCQEHSEGCSGRGRRGQDRLRELAALPGAQARRDPLPGRPDHARQEGAVRPRDDRGDGQGHQRGARRCPGSHRHGLLHGRRRSPPVRANDAERAAEQVEHVGPQADRRGRHHHAVELPDGDPVLEDLPGDRCGQHRRLQAGQHDRALSRPIRRDSDRGRRAGRRRQPRDRRRRRGRRRDHQPPGRPADLVHRLDRDRHRCVDGRGAS